MSQRSLGDQYAELGAATLKRQVDARIEYAAKGMSENTGLTAYAVYLDCPFSQEELVRLDTPGETTVVLLGMPDPELLEFIQEGQRYKVTITRAEPDE